MDLIKAYDCLHHDLLIALIAKPAAYDFENKAFALIRY